VREEKLCDQLSPSRQSAGEKDCKSTLWTLIDRSRNVAESILGSITQYVLPVCYGLLGAMAAALRLIRRKVDAATLVPTDRARLQQGAILGVLCGAVIGLFANQVGGAENANGLGLSALALIAGYNVDGVFRFLDSRTASSAPPPRQGSPRAVANVRERRHSWARNIGRVCR
jgi:hypothetical protein